MSIIGTVPHADQNNLSPGSGDAIGITIEPLLQTFSRYEFMFQNMGVQGQDFGNLFQVFAGLLPRTGVAPPYSDVTLANMPLAVEWKTLDPYLGPPGTVTETWFSFGGEIAQRPNIDPGFGLSGEVQRPGKRYCIMLAGTEYRAYEDYGVASGQKPICIVAGPSAGFPFPLRLGMSLTLAFTTGPFHIRSVALGGNLGAKTIYSARDKAADGLSAPFHFRIFQNGPGVDGLPVDVDM